MTTAFYWSLPRHRPEARPAPPGSLVRDVRAGRYSRFDLLAEMARAAEVGGFQGVTIPYDADGDDPWVLAAHLARHTRWLKVVTEFPLGQATPVYTSKMSATFQRFTGDRLVWQPVIGGHADELHAAGDWLEGDGRYHRADEFFRVTHGLWSDAPFSHRGTYFTVVDGGLGEPLSGRPFPPVALPGDTAQDLELAGAWADIHLVDLASPLELAAAREWARDAASSRERRRPLEHGVRVAILARPTAEEAWHEVERLWERAGAPGDLSVEDLRRDDHRWSGFAELGAARSGLVGSYDDVAARLDDLRRGGFEHLFLSGVAPLHDAYRTSQHVLSRLTTPAPAPA